MSTLGEIIDKTSVKEINSYITENEITDEKIVGVMLQQDLRPDQVIKLVNSAVDQNSPNHQIINTYIKLYESGNMNDTNYKEFLHFMNSYQEQQKVDIMEMDKTLLEWKQKEFKNPKERSLFLIFYNRLKVLIEESKRDYLALGMMLQELQNERVPFE